jgi:hypothetical protein
VVVSVDGGVAAAAFLLTRVDGGGLAATALFGHKLRFVPVA